MPSEFLKDLKRINDGRLYCDSDVIALDLTFNFLQPKSNHSSKKSIKKNVLDKITAILETGELPHLNPDFALNCTDDRTKLDKESLLEFICDNCYYSLQEIDINKNHVELSISISILFLNFRELAEEHLELVTYAKIKSFLLGEFEVGKKNKKIHVDDE